MGPRASKEQEYTINRTSDNKLGEGQYAEVYKVQKKDTQKLYAAKILKVPIACISSLQKLGYDRELQILNETDHPFVIKYQDQFEYKGAYG